MTGHGDDGPHRPDRPALPRRRKPGGGRGRPEVFTADQRDAYLAAIAVPGTTQQKAAADLGISARTVRWHTTHNPDFAQAVTQAKTAARDQMPHGETRYRALDCRCPQCVAAATAARIARRQHARQEREEETTGAEIHHLPLAADEPPPLAAGF